MQMFSYEFFFNKKFKDFVLFIALIVQLMLEGRDTFSPPWGCLNPKRTVR